MPPKVYTVGPSGSISFPEESSNLVESSTTSYGSSYSKQTSVRQENVVVPGAVQIVNAEEAQKRSNKLFDLVSGYGTFLPAKEEEGSAVGQGEVGVKSTGTSSNSYSSSAQTSQSGVSGGYNSGVTGGYNSGVTGGYNSGVTGGYNSGVGSYQSGNTGGYQSGVTGSQEYHTRVSGGGEGSYTSRTSGAYTPTSAVYQSVPVGTVRKSSTVYSSYNSNQGVPTHISPGIPIGDPLSPPEVSGSYFTSGGTGAKHTYSSNYASQSGYGTSGGYGRKDNLASGGYGGYSRDVASSGYSKDLSGVSGSGYGVKGASQDATLGVLPLCETALCENANIIPGSTGNVNKYGISSSWSSKSQTVNGKTTESKQAVVTVNDNGKVDTYATHT